MNGKSAYQKLKLPDTPPWSKWRKNVIVFCLIIFAIIPLASLIIPVFDRGFNPEVLKVAIQEGTSGLLWLAIFIITGAGGERALSWFSMAKGGALQSMTSQSATPITQGWSTDPADIKKREQASTKVEAEAPKKSDGIQEPDLDNPL